MAFSTNSGGRDIPCPVCGAPSDPRRALDAAFIRQALEEFVEASMPADLGPQGYVMRRCTGCRLEFADPMSPGSDAFYTWLDRTMKYYPTVRWEWDRVESEIRRASPAPTVLEVGAGDGQFLRRLAAVKRAVAIERSPAAVAALRVKRVESYTWEDARRELAGHTFDFVVAFHCLEHVQDPRAFVDSLRTYAGMQGRIFISVPYSPMYFESGWFDALNHPPHHLTRWNPSSLAALARHAGARASLSMPTAYSLLNRARYALAIRCLGPHWMRHRWRARLVPLLHPVKFAHELLRQAQRERFEGRPAADVVLVELCRAAG